MLNEVFFVENNVYYGFNMNNFFSKPFPFIEKRRYRILASIIFSVFILIFLEIFQPFGMSEIEKNKSLFIAGYSIINFSVMISGFFLLPCIFKRFFDYDNWTIGRTFVFTIYHFIIMVLLNWIYNSTVGLGIIQQKSLFYFLFSTIAVGITPTFILFLLMEKYLTKTNERFAADITDNIYKINKNNEETRICILSRNKNENIEIDLNDFLCLKAEGNYLIVYYRHDEIVKSKIIRNSITSIEEQLNKFSKVKRCHRSFLVNLNNVVKVDGNARNLSLHISKLEFTIPVSRDFPKEMIRDFST